MSAGAQRRELALTQGLYFLGTGIWPIVSRRGFERVTGPKADFWLVRMVGLLAASIGLTLLSSARREEPPAEVALLAASSAASFAAIDVVYVLRRRISSVYLGDALLELGFLARWLGYSRRR